jgi:hypothetical protein
MGTRSVTHIYEMSELGGKMVCSFFRHYDGYPSGHGKNLIQWLRGKILTNGIWGTSDKTISFNRAGTMAVKLMNHIQDKSGAEVIPTGTNTSDSEFTYHVGFTNGQFYVGCQSYDGVAVVWDVETVDVDTLDELFDNATVYSEITAAIFEEHLKAVQPAQQLLEG